MSKDSNSYFRNLLKEHVRNRCMQRLSEDVEYKEIYPHQIRPAPDNPVQPPRPPVPIRGGGNTPGGTPGYDSPGRWGVKPFDPINGDPRLPYHPVYNPGGYLSRPPGWSQRGIGGIPQNPSRLRPPLPYQPDWPGWGGIEAPLYPWAPWNAWDPAAEWEREDTFE